MLAQGRGGAAADAIGPQAPGRAGIEPAAGRGVRRRHPEATPPQVGVGEEGGALVGGAGGHPRPAQQRPGLLPRQRAGPGREQGVYLLATGQAFGGAQARQGRQGRGQATEAAPLLVVADDDGQPGVLAATGVEAVGCPAGVSAPPGAGHPPVPEVVQHVGGHEVGGGLPL